MLPEVVCQPKPNGNGKPKVKPSKSLIRAASSKRFPPDFFPALNQRSQVRHFTNTAHNRPSSNGSEFTFMRGFSQDRKMNMAVGSVCLSPTIPNPVRPADGLSRIPRKLERRPFLKP